jgi:hypothetical protein
MPMFDPQLIEIMRSALQEVMTRVPSDLRTDAVKAHLAEFVLKAAAEGQTEYDQLVSAAADQISVVLKLLA